MNWSEVFKWSLAVVSLVGVELNIRHRRECFYIWIFTNAAWSLVDFSHGIWAQSLLHLVYFALAIRGVICWQAPAGASAAAARPIVGLSLKTELNFDHWEWWPRQAWKHSGAIGWGPLLLWINWTRRG